MRFLVSLMLFMLLFRIALRVAGVIAAARKHGEPVPGLREILRRLWPRTIPDSEYEVLRARLRDASARGDAAQVERLLGRLTSAAVGREEIAVLLKRATPARPDAPPVHRLERPR